MPDEFDKPLENTDSDEYGEDAEAPILPQAAESATHHRHPEQKTNAAERYIQPTLRWLWLCLHWTIIASWVSIQWVGRRLVSASFWTAAATVVIAIATIFYTIYAKRQWKEIRDSSSDTHALAVAAGKQADATLAASRAWVVVEGTGFGFTKDKNFPFGRVVLADSGSSPAFGLAGWRCVEVRSDEPPLKDGQLQQSSTAVCLSIVGGALGKGVPITMNAFVPALVPANFSKETEGTGPHFFYWGVATYDIYPNDGKRHLTSFCLKNGRDQLSPCREGGYEAN